MRGLTTPSPVTSSRALLQVIAGPRCNKSFSGTRPSRLAWVLKACASARQRVAICMLRRWGGGPLLPTVSSRRERCARAAGATGPSADPPRHGCARARRPPHPTDHPPAAVQTSTPNIGPTPEVMPEPEDCCFHGIWPPYTRWGRCVPGSTDWWGAVRSWWTH